MKPYRYSISLRVRHPSMDPAAISIALKLEPERSWRARDQRTTPKGTPLEGRWHDTYWTARVLDDKCPDKPLPAALQELLRRFYPHGEFFRKIRAEAGRSEFFVGWYIDGNRGDVFDAVLLAEFAELSIDLSLDIYPLIAGRNRSD